MMSNKKFVVYTVIVCIFCSILGVVYGFIGDSNRGTNSDQLNWWIVAGSILVGPGLLGRWLIAFITSDDRIIAIVVLFSQFSGYLVSAFALRRVVRRPRFHLWLNNNLRVKKYIKY